MLKAVLFDLDNTLIRFDERTFFESYIPKILRVFVDIMPPDRFVENLLLATSTLVKNNGEISNAEYFMKAFAKGYEGLGDEMWRRFIKFYETDFDQFQALVSVTPGVREVFLRLKKMGLKLVIASNPIWPRTVQMKRLAWAGVGDLQFDLVTDVENMSYCKPRIEYYLEVCQKIDEKPSNCLMVGNDPVNDLVVARIDMKTFLITDNAEVNDSALELSQRIRDESEIEIPAPDFTGSITDVPHIVEASLGDK